MCGEFINTVNNANFGYPGDTYGTSSFGKVSNTLTSGRTVQLALKVHF